MFSNIYQSLILKNPRIVFLILILVTSFFLINTKKIIRGFFKINDWYIFENITKYISYI